MIVTENEEFEKEINVEKYWNILKAKYHILILLVFLAILIGVIYSFSISPVYEASGLIMIEPENQNMLMFSDRMMVGRVTNEYFNTQLRILKSRSIARNVLKEFAKPQYQNVSEKKINNNQEINVRNIDVFLSSLGVENINETRLIRVSYKASDPKKAAQIVNSIFKEFIEFNKRIKSSSAQKSSKFIADRINTLQKKLAQKEDELQKYSSKKNLFFLSNEENAIIGKYSDINTAYTNAQIEKVNKGSVYKELKNKKYESYPGILNSVLIGNLKNSYSQLEGEYSKKREIYKESYPELIQLRSQMKALNLRMNNEIKDLAQKTLKQAKNEFETALEKELSLKRLLEKQKGKMDSSNSDAIYYKSLNIEVTNMRDLMEYLDKKHQESIFTTDIEGLQINNIKIIDKAEPPLRRIAPKRKRLVMMAIFFGLFSGIFLIFLLDLFDKSFIKPEDVKNLLNVPLLGIIFSVGNTKGYKNYFSNYSYASKKTPATKNIELVNHTEPESQTSECFRNIRTSILLSTAGKPPKIISISSTNPSEGKTTNAINLAVSFCQLGKKVLLIDGDLRKPRIHKVFKKKNISGLSSFLVGRNDLNSIISKTEVPNLSLITSGPIPPNPVELLGSDQMKDLIKKLSVTQYDFIVIDTPPFVNIVDPVIIGKLSDGMILIVLHNKTSRKGIKNSLDKMKEFSIKNLGIVLNNMNLKSEYHSYAYSYKVADDILEEEKKMIGIMTKNEKKTKKKKGIKKTSPVLTKKNKEVVKKVKKSSETSKTNTTKNSKIKAKNKVKEKKANDDVGSKTSYSYSFIDKEEKK